MCRGRQEAEVVLRRPVEASEKREEAGLRRRSRNLPGQTGADEARQGDGGAIVFQRARQVDGVRAVGGLGRLTMCGQWLC